MAVDSRSAPIGSLMLELAAACRQFEAAQADIRTLDDLPGALDRRREIEELIAALLPRAREHGIDLAHISRTVSNAFAE